MADGTQSRAAEARTAIAERRDPWAAIRAYGRNERDSMLDIASERHNDRPCAGGECDGGEPASKCARHELTSLVAETMVDVRAVLEARLGELGLDREDAQLFLRDVLDGLLGDVKRGTL